MTTRPEFRGIGVGFLTRARDFSVLHNIQTHLRPTQPPIQWVPGTVPPELKRPGGEAHHSFPSSARGQE
jgi:hypothetical protein